MNNMLVVLAIIVAGVLINGGYGRSSQTMVLKDQKNKMEIEDRRMADELFEKQGIKRSKPQAISKAFIFFLNQTKMFESYSGTQMSIEFNNKEEEDIEDYYVKTVFRQVKGLPLTINIDKFSNETDMVEVLNDIYLLENHTDFKVTSIVSDNNTLIVKGELYGI